MVPDTWRTTVAAVGRSFTEAASDALAYFLGSLLLIPTDWDAIE